MINAQTTITIKLISPWFNGELVYDGVKFGTEISFDVAAGVLWEYSIDERIFKYSGIKGWYALEPSWHSMYGQRLYRRARNKLRPNEFFHFAHEYCGIEFLTLRTIIKSRSLVSSLVGVMNVWQ